MKKRIFSIVLTIAIATTLILSAVPAFAAQTYTVYAKVPKDWGTPAVWCWDDSEANPSDQGNWPGNYFMAKGDDGWWTVEIPVGYNNLLINANGGSVQTPDIKGLNGSDVWINAYTDPQNPVYSYEEFDVSCEHGYHDRSGICMYCGEYVGHTYGGTFFCACGHYTEAKTVYFKNSIDLMFVCLIWDNETGTSWLDADFRMNEEGNEIYSCEIPVSSQNIIITDTFNTKIEISLAGMTSTHNVYDPSTNSWITYEEAMPPVITPPDNDPIVPADPTAPSTPTDPTQKENNKDTDDNHSMSRLSEGDSPDPTAVYIILAAASVVVVVVVLIIIRKKKRQ